MNNQILNVNDKWLELKKVAELKNVTPRGIRLAIQKGKYISQRDVGNSYKILLSSLEPDVQNKYLNEYYINIVSSETSQSLAIIENKRQIPPVNTLLFKNKKRIALPKLQAPP